MPNTQNMIASTGMVGLMLLLLTSCAPVETTLPCSPTHFDTAISLLSNNLFSQVQKKANIFGSESKNFVIDLFIEETTGVIVKVSRTIQEMMIGEATKNFPHFKTAELSPATSPTADYIVIGFIHHKPLAGECHVVSGEKFYGIEANVFEKQTGLVIAKSRVWIRNKSQMNVEPILKEEIASLDTTNKQKEIGTEIGKQISEPSRIVEVNPLLSQAEQTLEQGAYQESVQLFQNALHKTSDSDDLMRIYRGLYRGYFKLGERKQAEEELSKFIEESMREEHLGFYIWFLRDSYDQFDNPEEYEIWIRQIGQYLKRTSQCVNITGHTSKTGTDNYNKELSRNRAQYIQKKLKKYFPDVLQRTEVIGKGSDECKKCVLNDKDSKVDRRVEFKVVECAKL